MATGKPSISDVRSLDVRTVATAISNIRQRIEALEGALTLASSTGSATATSNNTQLAIIRQQIAALQAAIAGLGGLVGQTPGIEVWNGTKTLTRLLAAGLGINIKNPDGVAGDPLITGLPQDFVLYDNTGRAALTSGGLAILKSDGV